MHNYRMYPRLSCSLLGFSYYPRYVLNFAELVVTQTTVEPQTSTAIAKCHVIPRFNASHASIYLAANDPT